MIETNEDYWDCECETNYIHKKTEDTSCVSCGAHHFDQPDSRADEVNAHTIER
jgi:Zn finger protein HypA/HybF involved in hydrogenase expression